MRLYLIVLIVIVALGSTFTHAEEDNRPSPMHVVFGSIPCYGHWQPLRAVAKAMFARGHHVSLLMEADKMKWCTPFQQSFASPAKSAAYAKPSVFNYSGIEGPTFNCIPLPASNTFQPDFFINMSKSDDIPNSFDHLFNEMFAFANVTQEAYSKVVYVLGDLTGSISKKHGTTRCTKDAKKRAALIGLSEELTAILCQLPPITLFLTDSGTFPTYTAARQFGLPSMALFPLSVNLATIPSSYLPMLGSGRPSLHQMSFFDRLATFTNRMNLSPVLEYIAVPQFLAPVRAEGNTRLKAQAAQFPDMPSIPPYQGGLSELGMMNSIVIAPGIWGYDVAQPLCPNVIAIGSTAVGDDGGDDGPGVTDRRIAEFGLTDTEEAVSAGANTALLARRELLEEQLAVFLDQAPACVNYGSVYVNFGTLSVISDETFNRVLAALWHVPFCVVWKIPEPERFDRVKNMLLKSEMPSELAHFATSILEMRSHTNSSINLSVANGEQQQPAAPDTGSNPRGRFYLGKHFASPDAILEHPNTKVFVSHCGDTSVLESIAALVPVAGIPIFADQPDVCQRIEESGIGSYIGPKSTFEPKRLIEMLNKMGLTSGGGGKHSEERPPRFDYLSRMQQVRHMSTLLGGPAKAATVIESHYLNGLLDTKTAALKRQSADGPTFPPASSPGMYFNLPSACLPQTTPYANREAFRESMGYPTDEEQGNSPYIGLESLIIAGNIDILAIIFATVGFWYLLAIRVVKAVCRRLFASMFGGKKKTASKHQHDNNTTTTTTTTTKINKPSETIAGLLNHSPNAALPSAEHIRIRAVTL